eukprot:COSAG03_NODE_38325_length_104_cov_3582.600000_1_plen_20_part_10
MIPPKGVEKIMMQRVALAHL